MALTVARPRRFDVRFDDLLALWVVVNTRAPDFALGYHASRRAAERAARGRERRLSPPRRAAAARRGGAA